MTLRIVKASDPVKVEQINLCIYSGPGLGKTSLGFTASDPLLLDADHGTHRAAIRKDSVSIRSWDDVASMTKDDLEPYKTLVVDTAGRMLDYLTADIIKGNPKAGRADGSLTLQGFGTLKARFTAWLKMVNTFGKDVVLIAHMDEQRSGDDIIERLDVQGGSKAEIYKSVDAMGRIFLDAKSGRVIDFSPRPNAFGKNPCNLEVLSFPDPRKDSEVLSKIIELIKSRLNEASDAQLAEHALVEEWREALADMTTVDEINNLLPEVSGKSIGVKAVVFHRAKELGFNFNKTAGLYEAQPCSQSA